LLPRDPSMGHAVLVERQDERKCSHLLMSCFLPVKSPTWIIVLTTRSNLPNFRCQRSLTVPGAAHERRRPPARPIRMRIGAFFFLFLMNITSSATAECTVRSGPTTAALVELYTSEGCSSCPPADRWLATIGQSARDRAFVPIAFHVAYWDYLGWKDPYADMRFT